MMPFKPVMLNDTFLERFEEFCKTESEKDGKSQRHRKALKSCRPKSNLKQKKFCLKERRVLKGNLKTKIKTLFLEIFQDIECISEFISNNIDEGQSEMKKRKSLESFRTQFKRFHSDSDIHSDAKEVIKNILCRPRVFCNEIAGD